MSVPQLAALFPVVNSALASLSAYATTSGPSAKSIVAVVDAFAAADDALHQRYAHAVDTWRAQLVALKDLEDDLAAVLHDRDILVGTRLLKASRSSSCLFAQPSNSASLPSNNTIATPFSLYNDTNAKLAQAQAELQACEAQLLAKERELDARRIAVAHDGLGARCRALIDCAALWTDMGKQGLKALQALGQNQCQNDGSLVSTPDLGAPLVYSPSRIAAHSTEANFESPPSSKQHADSHAQAAKSKSELKPQLESEVQLTRKSKLNANVDTNMTLNIALPPTHPIPKPTVPMDIRLPSREDHLAPETATQRPPTSKMASTSSPAPLLSRTSITCLPQTLSQHIADISEQTSDGPHCHHSQSKNNSTVDASTNTTLLAPPPRFLSPQAIPPRDTSCSDESNDEYGDRYPNCGPLQVVENDSIEVVRRSIVISPRSSVILMPITPNTTVPPPNTPNALVSLNTPRAREMPVSTSARPTANTPDIRTSIQDPIAGSASNFVMDPGSVSVSGPVLQPAQPQLAGRGHRSSLTLFGSLQGLFRKPNNSQQQEQKRGRGVVTEWEASDERRSAEPSGRVSTGPRVEVNWRRAGGGRGGGWITRTDAQSRGEKHVGKDLDVQYVATTSAANTAMLVKGSDASRFVGLPSWRRQGHGNGSGVGSINGSALSIPVHVLTTVRVDGWVTDEQVGMGTGSKVMNIASGKGKGVVTTEATDLGKSQTARRSMMKRRKTSVAHLRGSDHGQSDGEVMAGTGETSTKANPDLGPGVSLPSCAATRHRHLASLSEMDMQRTMLSSLPTPSQTPVLSQHPTYTPSSTSFSSPRPHARRQAQVGNGQNNQSLMGMVADVTGQHPHLRQDDDRTRPSDARAPVLSKEAVADRDQSSIWEARSGVGIERRLGMDTAITTTMTNGRGHVRSASSLLSGRSDAERGRGRNDGPVKMPLPSALRNESRTPSPGPASMVTPMIRTTTMTTGMVGLRGDARPGDMKSDDRNQVRRSWRDSASVSSYVTGRESWNGEVPSRVPSPATPLGLRSRSESPVPTQAEPSLTILTPVEPLVAPTAIVTGSGHANPNAKSSPNLKLDATHSVQSSSIVPMEAHYGPCYGQAATQEGAGESTTYVFADAACAF